MPPLRRAPVLLFLVFASAAATQDTARDASGPDDVLGRPSVGWDDVRWLETRMHLRQQPAPGAIDAPVILVSLEPATTTADDPGIAAESSALKRLGRRMHGRAPLRVWLRPDAETPFGDRTVPALDGTVPADAPLFEAYGFDGTAPRRVVLDHRGVVRRVVAGRLGPDDVEFVRTLLLEPPATSQLVGRVFPQPGEDAARRLSDAPLITPDRWTLLRWWTNGCPFCEASLPAIDALRTSFPKLDVVAVYHPKPPREVGPDAIRAWAKDRSFDGVLASDAPRWSTFRALRALGLEPGPTSISLLVGPDGTIRWVHPGPRLHPSPDGAHPEAAADHARLVALLDALFAAADATGRDR